MAKPVPSPVPFLWGTMVLVEKFAEVPNSARAISSPHRVPDGTMTLACVPHYFVLPSHMLNLVTGLGRLHQKFVTTLVDAVSPSRKNIHYIAYLQLSSSPRASPDSFRATCLSYDLWADMIRGS